MVKLSFSAGKAAVRTLLGVGLFCSLSLPQLREQAESYYGGPVPASWRPSLRWQSHVLRDTFFPDLTPSRRRLAAVQDLARCRRFSKEFYAESNRNYRRLLDEQLGGLQVSLHSGQPYSDERGVIYLFSPDVLAHEWLHAHPEVSRNHYSAADAMSTYLHCRKELVARGRMVGFRVPHYGGKRFVYYWDELPNEAASDRHLDFKKIDAAFRKPDGRDHDRKDAAGGHLGALAWLEEFSERKPGLGLVILKLVYSGIPVEKALKVAGLHSQEAHRRMLIRRNPELNWLKPRKIGP